MNVLPYPLGQLSGLGLLWTSLSGAYIIKGLYQVVASGGSRDFDGEKGLLRFTKRPVRRMFIALGVNGAVCIAAYNSYCFGISNFRWLDAVISRLSDTATTSTDEMSVLVGGSLLFTHTIVRLYMSVYVNVFSSTTTQDVLDWLAPQLYSFLAGVTVLSGAPALNGSGLDWFSWSAVSWRHLVGVGLFGLLSYNDRKLQHQLARFRKNRAGHVVSEDHKMPKGGLFDMVSSPHFLTEVLIHGAIGLTLGCQHQSWWLCTAYVATSQTVRALGRQKWYRKKFEAFPSGCKAIIPYII